MKNKPGRSERIAKVRDYTERCKASGDKFRPMWCPHCRFELEAKVPDDDPYTSLATCPSCEGLFHYTSRLLNVTVTAPGLRNMTNIEVMRHLMEGPGDHPMQQVFIIHALINFCEGVAKAKPGFMEGNMVDEGLWRELAKKVGDTLNQYPMVKDRGYDDEEEQD